MKIKSARVTRPTLKTVDNSLYTTWWIMDDEITRKLMSTNDAMVWAREFVKINYDHLEPGIDWEGVMVGWFANAMEAQRLSND